MDLLPGGYNFIHAVFWVVMALVGVGTMTVATILVAGLACYSWSRSERPERFPVILFRQ